MLDAEDFERVLSFGPWQYQKGYAVNCKRIGLRVLNKRKTTPMHRFILNAPHDLEVDHINGDPLDNRKSNLRLCTRSQNSRNTKTPKTNTSGYKGVSWNKYHKKWSVRIRNGAKYEHGGYYDDKEMAAIRYNELAINYYGEFARLNIIFPAGTGTIVSGGEHTAT